MTVWAGSRGLPAGVAAAPLWEAVARKMFVDDLTYRQVAAGLGFHPQTLTMLKKAARREDVVNLTTRVYLSLCWWLGRSADDFTRTDRDAA